MTATHAAGDSSTIRPGRMVRDACLNQSLSSLARGPLLRLIAIRSISNGSREESFTVNRRTFLSASSAAGAAFLLPLSASADQPSGGGAQRQQKPAEKRDDEEDVTPPEDLMREHGALKRVLLVYGEAIRRIDARQDLPSIRRRGLRKNGRAGGIHREDARHLRLEPVHAEGVTPARPGRQPR